MSIASNGENFEVQLRAAVLKLSRIENGIDPISGFTELDIRNFIVDLPEKDNKDQQAIAAAALRRYGYNA